MIHNAVVIVKFCHTNTGNTKSSAHVTINLGLPDQRKIVFPADECGSMCIEYHYLQLAGVPDGTPFVGHATKTKAKEVREWGLIQGYVPKTK